MPLPLLNSLPGSILGTDLRSKRGQVQAGFGWCSDSYIRWKPIHLCTFVQENDASPTLLLIYNFSWSLLASLLATTVSHMLQLCDTVIVSSKVSPLYSIDTWLFHPFSHPPATAGDSDQYRFSKKIPALKTESFPIVILVGIQWVTP